MSEVIPLAPESLPGMHKAQQVLRQQADKLTAIGDPSGPTVAGLAAAMEATARLVLDATLAQQKLAAEARKPLADEDMRKAVTRGIVNVAGHAVRALNVRNTLIGVALGVGFMLAGAVGGYVFRDAVPLVVGLRAGADQCQDRPDGSRLCWIPVFDRMPTGR